MGKVPCDLLIMGDQLINYTGVLISLVIAVGSVGRAQCGGQTVAPHPALGALEAGFAHVVLLVKRHVLVPLSPNVIVR